MDVLLSKKEIQLDKENVIGSKMYKVEKKELRETESMKEECLTQLRTWIKQNNDIENCHTDDGFLLRFLRVRKFSIPMAQQTLLKYLNFRQKFKHVMCNLDYTKPRTNDLIDKGYIYVSPYRDCNGRRVIFYDLSKIDVQSDAGLDIQRADAITFETLLDNEDTQVMGVTHVIQSHNIGPSLIPLFYTKDFGYLIKWGEQSFPMRHKSFIVTGLAPSLKYFFEIARGLLSPKLRDRIWLDDSVDILEKKLGKKCLPLELGGTIPIKEMQALWKEELESKREKLLSLDIMKLLSDKGIITKRNSPKQDETGYGSVSGSFRKLNID